ncbi:hypothetical protein SAMN04487897_104330 [Paenibacillus sp. yr247]|uniref:hypothetical protein n=1 Tax=Paenibacillus sp. yr247 TaxID=1761880 RepID=UPI00088F7952|nr:hypothetical protein [Paenibacillus sp. yr247]SDN76325.1 hypothetical protein SAMN04487897_104330 [Paenibacillus sp. yr247]
MMKYGDEHVEHRFTLSFTESEIRGQWRDIFLGIHKEAGEEFPEDLIDPSILVICNLEGEIVQIVLHDEGCDCEFQFTFSEKAQIENYVQQHVNV